MVNGLDIVSYILGKKSASGNVALYEWDFTSENPLVDKIRGKTIGSNSITFDENGANFDGSTDNLKVGNLYYTGIIITIDFFAMALKSGGSNKRCIMGTQSSGLIYRSSGVWGFYSGGEWATDTSETSGSFFNNSRVKIFVDLEGYWHIYKDGELWYEPDLTLALSDFMLGSNGGSAMNNATVKSIKFEFSESGV